MKKALLLIDRGSREQDVRDELQTICAMAGQRGNYHHSTWCFLEVMPPYIEEGIRSCVSSKPEFLTIMPYFLYPGMKMKLAIKQGEEIARQMGLKYAVTECLNFHANFIQIIRDRVGEVKKNNISHPDSECDVLLIGHGSSDRDARIAFERIAGAARQFYKSTNICFLELDTPNIEQGIRQSIEKNPKALILVPYFLHNGAHIKRDVKEEVQKTLKEHSNKNVFMAGHIGVDDRMIDVILERAREAESRVGV